VGPRCWTSTTTPTPEPDDGVPVPGLGERAYVSEKDGIALFLKGERVVLVHLLSPTRKDRVKSVAEAAAKHD